VRDANRRGEGLLLAFGDLFTAILHNGLGEYSTALTAARRASDRVGLGFMPRALPELVEAAVYCEEPDLAAAALARLREFTVGCASDWAHGVEAYATALVDGDEHADAHFRAALDHLTRDGREPYRARAHLLYGEWLGRRRRHREAREQLHQAHRLFTTMGAEAFAGRAERELLTAGEKVPTGHAETRESLTAREAQIAQLARDGLSNPEIGARLFISRRTVEYHLAKVFAKLDIRSRRELDGVLPADARLEAGPPDRLARIGPSDRPPAFGVTTPKVRIGTALWDRPGRARSGQDRCMAITAKPGITPPAPWATWWPGRWRSAVTRRGHAPRTRAPA
jgi:DNA-binding CsgD family transcriptional regulator